MRKTDRTASLLKLMQVLHQSPDRMTPQEIAYKCEVRVRTIYRDLLALENELGLPVWEHKGKRAGQ